MAIKPKDNGLIIYKLIVLLDITFRRRISRNMCCLFKQTYILKDGRKIDRYID